MTTRPQPRTVDAILDPHDQLDELLATRGEFSGRAGQAEWRSRWNAAMDQALGRANALPTPSGGGGPGHDTTATRGNSLGQLAWTHERNIHRATGPSHTATIVERPGNNSWMMADLANGQVVSSGAAKFLSDAKRAVARKMPGVSE
jgi:hypothetical protein